MGSLGVPLSEAYVRPDDGKVVQQFAAAALELHPNAIYDPDFTQLTLPQQIMRVVRPLPIGRTYTAGVTFPPQEPVTPGPDVRLFPDTGYVVKGQFLTFYDTFLGTWRLGNPISPELVENIGGVDVTVQYFENGRLEWSPQTNVVQFGQINQALWLRQCQQAGL
jgi:hypothetical protein